MTFATPKNTYNLLKISCFLLFIGRAWQFLFRDAPLRALLWDEELMEGLITSVFNITWQEYVTSPATDLLIQSAIRTTGLFFLLMAGVVLFLQPKFKPGKILLIVSSFILLFLAFLYCKEKFYHHGQFFEYSIQFSLPIFLLVATYFRDRISKVQFTLYLKIAIALTFVSHGLYAIGFYPRPGVFVDMTINSIGVSEPVAHQLLFVAGILDFVAAVGLFMPKIAKPFIIYCVIWGLLTALARTWANLQADYFSFEILSQYLPQTLYRLPHGLLPAVLLLPFPRSSGQQKESPENIRFVTADEIQIT